jgi:hypothetical protein
MKLSLKKIMLNDFDRRPDIDGSETNSFLKFIESQDGYSAISKAYKNLFNEFNEKSVDELILFLIKDGWLKKDYINQLDVGIFVTDKFKKLQRNK